MKQTLEIFKIELATNGLQDISFLVLKFIELDLTFPQFQPREGNFFYIRIAK